MSKVTLATALSREECTRRLSEAIDPDFSLLGGSPVRGTIGRKSFGLTKRLRWSRNPFQTRVRGRLTELPPGGTRIVCTTGIDTLSTIVIMIALDFFLWMVSDEINAAPTF